MTVYVTALRSKKLHAHNSLTDWPTDWMTDGLTYCLTDQLTALAINWIDWLIDPLTDCLPDKMTDWPYK